MPLSDRQALCLAVIESSIRVHGRSPTYFEIGEAMDLNQRQVASCLSLLCRKQVIAWQAGEFHVLKPSASALNAIRFARSDADWIADLAIVCEKNGFSGRIEQLPKWLDEQLSVKAKGSVEA